MLPLARVLWATTVLVSAGALAGCDLPGVTDGDSSSPSAQPSSTPTTPPADLPSSPSPTEATSSGVSPEPTDSITIVCTTAQGEVDFTLDRQDPDWASVWSTSLSVPAEYRSVGLVPCADRDADTGPPLTPVSDEEQAVWAAAQDDPGGRDRSTLATLYAYCAEHDVPGYAKPYPRNAGQVGLAERWLALCPAHPDASAIRSRIATLQAPKPTPQPSTPAPPSRTPSPHPAPVRYYGSCDDLHEDYPAGVARSVAIADAASREGFLRPAATPGARAIWSANSSNLDRDDDGIACEVPA